MAAKPPRNPMNQETSPDYRSEEQQDQDLKDRRSALLTTIDHAHAQRWPAIEFVDIADMLGLEEELDELAAGTALQRQRRLIDVRAELAAGVRLE